MKEDIIKLFEKPYVALEIRAPEVLIDRVKQEKTHLSQFMRNTIYALIRAHEEGETDFKDIVMSSKGKNKMPSRRITIRIPLGAHDYVSQAISPMKVSTFCNAIAKLHAQTIEMKNDV